MYEGQPENKHDKWTVRAELVARKPGVAVVRLRLSNAAFGDLQPIELSVDWKPGMEAADAEAFALQLVGQSAGFLSAALIREGVTRQLRGD